MCVEACPNQVILHNLGASFRSEKVLAEAREKLGLPLKHVVDNDVCECACDLQFANPHTKLIAQVSQAIPRESCTESCKAYLCASVFLHSR